MEEFTQLIDRIGKLWALVLAGGLLAPVLIVFSGFAPKTTTYSVLDLGLVTAFLGLLVLLNVWVFGRRLRHSRAKWTFGLLSVAALALLVGYSGMILQYQVTQGERSVVGGCGWTEVAVKWAQDEGRPSLDQCPGDAGWLLDEAALPHEIWDPASVRHNELKMLGLWAGLTMAWIGLVAFFALAFLRARSSAAPSTE